MSAKCVAGIEFEDERPAINDNSPRPVAAVRHGDILTENILPSATAADPLRNRTRQPKRAKTRAGEQNVPLNVTSADYTSRRKPLSNRKL